MGVTGLWTVVHPSARPTNLTTLNRKRLAVDASIWIYQFLKAVRDKEGNVLRNSHVVGFFRRICKLLYHGIKPVFVFDGGAPALKRQTISGRKSRREGRREDAVRTAGKLLALQMQRRAEEEEQKRKDLESGRNQQEEELPTDQELVYVDELGLSAKERQQNRTFRKKDAYHLPELDVSLREMGAPNDPRIMSQHELEEYARQFHRGEDINFYDFSKIDFDGPFFMSLPASDRYNILNAARLRSRLRMGHSKDQLDEMFPDRMAFSKFQIDRVRERNELTQRLMNINGMSGEDFLSQGARIAGEKGKEYVLVKNDGVEGGWALGVVSNNEGRQEQPIDVETYGQKPKDEEEADEGEDEGGFEDVPIEGLNRIPKNWVRTGPEVDYDTAAHDRVEEIARKRRAVYEARRNKVQAAQDSDAASQMPEASNEATVDDPDSLFIPENNANLEDDEGMDELFEDVDMGKNDTDDDDDLQKAIAMSLQKSRFDDDEGGFSSDTFNKNKPKRSFKGDAFNKDNARAGREIARGINQRASRPVDDAADLDPSDDDDGYDLQAALAESRKSKPQLVASERSVPATQNTVPPKTESRFSGPLPFESLNLGQSLLGKKKSEKIEEQLSGGFEKDTAGAKKDKQPLPPWFTAEATKETVRERSMQQDEDELYVPQAKQAADKIRKAEDNVIDLDAPSTKQPEIIDVDVSEASEVDEEEEPLASQSVTAADDTPVDDTEMNMGDVADLTRAEPPTSDIPTNISMPAAEVATDQTTVEDENVDWSETDEEDIADRKQRRPMTGGQSQPEPAESSTPETQGTEIRNMPKQAAPDEKVDDDDEDVEFEDVDTTTAPSLLRQESSDMHRVQRAEAETLPLMDDNPEGDGIDDEDDLTAAAGPQAVIDEDEEVFIADDSDDEIMQNLAIEAEEHARFAATLNNSVEPLTNDMPSMVDYEAELRQLRNQQKKDRRDADEVTQTMIQECQMLLSHFGLPYITAPMEAEAQCAELVHLGLVDGIITDDSDVFLFGGTRIYKNMFNAAKFVECYLSSDLEREYDLTRDKLIAFAHLLGSDYTEGIPGVGPVTALEILTEFDTLEQFRDWWSRVQLTDPKTLTPDTEPHYDFFKKYKKQLTKLFLPPHFPDARVEQAYLKPEVDSDPNPFQWGIPNLASLRQFLMSTIGWSQDRTDEILVPVIRDINRREIEGTQANITRFFGGGVGVGARQIGDKGASRGLADPQGISRGTGSGSAAQTNAAGDEREVFAPRIRESGRMAKAFGRLRGEAERKRKRGGNEGSPEAATASPDVEDTANNDPDAEANTGTRSKKKKPASTKKTTTKTQKPKRAPARGRRTQKKKRNAEVSDDEDEAEGKEEHDDEDDDF